jgi:hypothetical protein
MNATADHPSGPARLMFALAGACAGYILLVPVGGDAIEWLLWHIEHLTDIPGLSGLFLLLLSPLAFLAGCFLVDWVLAGFRRAS